MGRIPVTPCPKCSKAGLRRVYLQNPAGGERPHHEPVKGWLYCDNCGHMQSTKKVARQSNP